MHPLRFVRWTCLLAAAWTLGCAPSLPSTPPPGQIVIAQYDPTQSAIPLPNDLLLNEPVSALNVAPAQGELIATFQQKGGFPNDQEVPITVGFTTVPTSASGTASAPALDLKTFTPTTFLVAVATPQQSGPAPIEPLSPADYVINGTVGTLTIHHQGRTPWPPGEYYVFIRGGPNGVKTTAGDPVNPSQIFYLIEQGQDLTAPQNIGLLAAQAGSIEAATPLAKQLNGIISIFQRSGAFATCDTVFPHQELAVATSFAIAPLATQVQLDPGRGLVPLPIDLLRNPGPTGTLTPLAACTLAAGTLLDGGQCTSSAAAGFAALDGFSTTGAILAPTSDLIQAASVTGTTVQLWDLTNPASPALVSPATYIDAPCEFASTCDPAGRSSSLTSVVALQPAGATSGDPTSIFRTRPLKDATEYAVLISDGVLDKAGNGLKPGTVASILQFANPLVDANAHSQLQGVDDLTAGALEIMRQELASVLAAAAQAGIGKGHVAMAYTFRTQTILSTATKLAALPYAAAPSSFLGGVADGGVNVLTASAAFGKYGVDPVLTPMSNIGNVLEAQLVTLNLLDPATGAFFPDPSKAQPEVIDALISVPKVPVKNGQGLTPVVVFRHGLGGARTEMLPIADAFNKRGIILAAIDAAKHGERSFCAKGDVTTTLPGIPLPLPICKDGAACQSPLPAGAQGDTNPPGTCAAGYNERPVSNSCFLNPVGCNWTVGSNGIPLTSGNFLISPNFFRSRDTFRQDMIDQSQFIRVLAPVPPSPIGPLGNPVFDYLLSQGIVINPAQIGFIGQSLGSIQGTADVASNPRITSAVFNVGGGTTVDVFTNSPAFSDLVNQLLAQLGIAPGSSSYLQFLVVAKTVLDPADPINFAGHIQSDTLPNLLVSPPAPQSPKTVLAQAAYCDQTVPNPFNYIFDSTLGTSPLPGGVGFGGPGDFQVYLKGTSAADAAALAQPCATEQSHWVNHGFLIDFSDPLITLQVQSDASHFLLDGTQPNSLIILP